MSADEDALARARNEGFRSGVQWVTDEMVKVLRSLPGGALMLMADVLSRALKEQPVGEAVSEATSNDLRESTKEGETP